jgi:hypothetical protein
MNLKRVRSHQSVCYMYGLQDNSLELVKGLFDFVRCERPNGTAYGTAGQCRKGVEAEKEENEGIRLTPQQEAVQAQLIKNVADMFRLDKEKTAEFYKEVREERERVLKEMSENQITRGEIDSFVLDHPGKGNFMTATVITVGMEETLPKDPTPREIDEGMAVRFAQERVRRKHGLDHLPKELVVAGEIQTPGEPLHRIATGETRHVPGGPFWREQALLLTQAGAKNVADGSSYKLYSSTTHAGLELGAIPAASTGAWPVGSRPWVTNVAAVHQAIGNREGSSNLYHRQRVRALMGQLDKAISGNPNLTTVSLAPGKGRKGVELTNLVFSHLQSKGAQVYERTIQATNGGTTAVVRVAVMQGAGGKPVTVIDPGISVSAQGITKQFKQNVGQFLTEVKSGQVEPTGFHRHQTAKDERKEKKKEERAVKAKVSPTKRVEIQDPVVSGKRTLAALRAAKMSDKDIRRNFPKLNQIWDKIQ